PLGTGITLSGPLSHDHDIESVVRDTAVTTAGYQGSPQPNQWFGGPALSTSLLLFGRLNIIEKEGSMVLRDAAGHVVDSLNYGGLIDPWAAEGYQAASGAGKNGCYVTAPGAAGAVGPFASAIGASNTSAGRFPDGADTGSNCTDFHTAPATTLAASAAAGADNIKVAGVDGFSAGQTIRIGNGADLETAVIASVGTPGATTVRTATAAGATEIPVANPRGFRNGESITIGSGSDSETNTIVRTTRFGAGEITVAQPLTKAHESGAQVVGSGITLTSPLAHEHAGDAQVTGSISTPGAPNHYDRESQ
ncbi:MAG TPA: alpha-N-arabinofuranosidase, partial [Terracidiphilus sp.]